MITGDADGFNKDRWDQGSFGSDWGGRGRWLRDDRLSKSKLFPLHFILSILANFDSLTRRKECFYISMGYITWKTARRCCVTSRLELEGPRSVDGSLLLSQRAS